MYASNVVMAKWHNSVATGKRGRGFKTINEGVIS